MSKERLVEFKNMLNDNFDTAYYAGITLTYEQLYYLTEKLGKEIEYRTAYEKLYKQNKRYRTLLERACQAEDMEDIWDIEDDFKALEESE